MQYSNSGRLNYFPSFDLIWFVFTWTGNSEYALKFLLCAFTLENNNTYTQYSECWVAHKKLFQVPSTFNYDFPLKHTTLRSKLRYAWKKFDISIRSAYVRSVSCSLRNVLLCAVLETCMLNPFKCNIICTLPMQFMCMKFCASLISVTPRQKTTTSTPPIEIVAKKWCVCDLHISTCKM